MRAHHAGWLRKRGLTRVRIGDGDIASGLAGARRDRAGRNARNHSHGAAPGSATTAAAAGGNQQSRSGQGQAGEGNWQGDWQGE